MIKIRISYCTESARILNREYYTIFLCVCQDCIEKMSLFFYLPRSDMTYDTKGAAAKHLFCSSPFLCITFISDQASVSRQTRRTFPPMIFWISSSVYPRWTSPTVNRGQFVQARLPS